MIRVMLPTHLQILAGAGRTVELDPGSPATIRSLLDALERRWPALRGTIRDQSAGERRPYIRFFACGEDYSLQGMDEPLPAPVAAGDEPFRIVGAMAGG